MNALIAKAASAACYATGHVISRTLLRVNCLAFFYPLYNTFIGWSYGIEERAGISFLWRPTRTGNT